MVVKWAVWAESAAIAGVDAAIVGMDAAIVGIRDAIAGSIDAVVGMNDAISGSDAVIVGMNAAIVRSVTAIAGMVAAIAGLFEAIVFLNAAVVCRDAAIAGMERGVIWVVGGIGGTGICGGGREGGGCIDRWVDGRAWEDLPPLMNEVDPMLIRPALQPFLRAIAGPLRWRILRELCKGEPLMVVELAKKLNCAPTKISKHLLPLRELGLVTANRAGMYRIPAAYVVSSEALILDFGHCRLRMGEEV